MTTNSTIENFFLCVGAQKSGTTWLARVLANHPELFLTPVKEIHYFDHVRGITQHLSSRKRRSRYRKYHQRMWTQLHRFGDYRGQWRWYRDYMKKTIDDDWYRRLFAHRGGKPFAGEVTPEYAIIGEEGYRHVRKLAPDARVLFIMRNPVTQAWSQALHYCRSNGIDATRMPAQDLIALLGQPRFREISDYPATLDNLAAVFDQDQRLTMFYEEMHADRAAALAAVCRFIGIGFDAAMFPGLGRRFNRSETVAIPKDVRSYLRRELAPVRERVGRIVGHVPGEWEAEFAGV